MTTRESLKELINRLPEDNLELAEEFLGHLTLNLTPDNREVCKIVPRLLTLQYDKEKVYGSSWKKYEHVGTFFNLSRKTDRVENIMKRAMKEGMEKVLEESASSPTETFIDTIADIANYSLLWLTLLKSTVPSQYERFLELNDLK